MLICWSTLTIVRWSILGSCWSALLGDKQFGMVLLILSFESCTQPNLTLGMIHQLLPLETALWKSHSHGNGTMTWIIWAVWWLRGISSVLLVDFWRLALHYPVPTTSSAFSSLPNLRIAEITGHSIGVFGRQCQWNFFFLRSQFPSTYFLFVVGL